MLPKSSSRRWHGWDAPGRWARRCWRADDHHQQVLGACGGGHFSWSGPNVIDDRILEPGDPEVRPSEHGALPHATHSVKDDGSLCACTMAPKPGAAPGSSFKAVPRPRAPGSVPLSPSSAGPCGSGGPSTEGQEGCRPPLPLSSLETVPFAGGSVAQMLERVLSNHFCNDEKEINTMTQKQEKLIVESFKGIGQRRIF